MPIHSAKPEYWKKSPERMLRGKPVKHYTTECPEFKKIPDDLRAVNVPNRDRNVTVAEAKYVRCDHDSKSPPSDGKSYKCWGVYEREQREREQRQAKRAAGGGKQKAPATAAGGTKARAVASQATGNAKAQALADKAKAARKKEPAGAAA